MVVIHAEKPVVDMFKFFWRELELIGVRATKRKIMKKQLKY